MEVLGVDARGEALQRSGGPERSGQATSRVLTEVGHDVAARPDPAHRLPADWQRDPADLVAMGAGDNAFRAGPPQVWCEQAERRGRSEPDRTAAMLDQRRDDATASARGRDQQTGRVSDHRERLVGIERGRASVIGCVHDNRTLRLSNRDGVNERLDSADSGRKVVRHDERSAHGSRASQPRTAMAQQGPASTEADIGPDKIRPPAGGGAGGRISRGGLGET